jgi:hypothetical protein
MKKLLIICSLIAMGLVSCHSSEESHDSKTTWEHKVIKITGKGIKSQAAQLNELGLLGWELINIDTEITTSYTRGHNFGASVNVGTCAINAVMKRPIAGMKTPNGQTAWEYNIVQIAGKKLSSQNKTLNELGAQGWEVIGSFSELGTLRSSRYSNVCDIRTTSVDYTLRNAQTEITAPDEPSTEAETPTVVESPKWEYKILQVAGKNADAHSAMLNELGRDGWLLVSSHTENGESGLQRSGWRAAYINTYAVDHIFKRRIAEQTPVTPVK